MVVLQMAFCHLSELVLICSFLIVTYLSLIAFPIIANFLFEIISLSRDQRLEITGGIWKHENSVNSHKVSQVHILGNCGLRRQVLLLYVMH